MLETRRYSFTAWVCESAGLVGMAAALVAFSLAYSGQPRFEVWVAMATSCVGNLAYIVHVLTRHITGERRLSWRELILANLVPVVALGVTLVLAGEIAGLFHLPFVGMDNPPQKIITASPGAGS